MALSFIGKPISLISHSDVRYRGILAGIDPAASTIQLSNVFSMGTESRRPPSEFIPPVQEPYQYIIFRASEVKDLAVDEPAPPSLRSVHDDPAVLGASAPGTQPQYGAYGPQYQQPVVAQPPPPQAQAPAYPQPVPVQDAPAPPTVPVVQTTDAPGPSTGPSRVSSVHTAAASMETVQRALGDLRGSGNTAPAHGGRGGRRGGHHGHGGETKDIKVPSTDFDFQSSNARFDKTAVAPKKKDSDTENGVSSDRDSPTDKKDEKDDLAYNPTKSFFDSLSSSTQAAPPPTRGTGGRRGGGGRNRREEERERNVATFGEPGGVGLMGPGAYVGGWGGYGRRGGRPRGRGAPPVGGR